MKLRYLALAACLASPPAAAQDGPKASFDCKKAATSVEKAICDGNYTAELDRAMDEVYKAALVRAAAPPQKSALETAQRQWLTKRNTSCGRAKVDSDCIARLYKQRIVELVPLARAPDAKGPFVTGRYAYREKGEAGEMFLAELPDGTAFVLVETVNTAHISPHSCTFGERVKANGDLLDYREPKTSEACGLQIKVTGNRAVMSEAPKDCFELARYYCGAHGFMLGNYVKK